jgi:hypothetical protein
LAVCRIGSTSGTSDSSGDSDAAASRGGTVKVPSDNFRLLYGWVMAAGVMLPA